MAREIGLSTGSFKSFVVATGSDVDTNMAVTGITMNDELLSVIAINGDGSQAVAVLDVTSEASITSAGNIQCTTTNINAHNVLVFWLVHDKVV
jgi:hypothetical protein